MATIFSEPSGDATGALTLSGAGTFSPVLWSSKTAGVTLATDFVNSGHVHSLSYVGNALIDRTLSLADAGSRISLWVYIVSFAAGTADLFRARTSPGGLTVFRVMVTSAGVLVIQDGSGGQIGSNGSTLSTGVWVRLSMAYTITSTTVNRLELFRDGVSDISVTNGTLVRTGSSIFVVGNQLAGFSFRSSDHYIDNSASLTDPGNIYVTAKRPNANGTTNGFVTQIGAGGSGYGSGHTPQVNERPLDITNGWSIVTVGVAVTEEYNIENAATGDGDLTGFTIVDYASWVHCKALVAETGKIICNGSSTNISITTAALYFASPYAASSTYPAGSGTDVGMTTSTAITTVSLYECGVVVVCIPAAGGTGGDWFRFF